MPKINGRPQMLATNIKSIMPFMTSDTAPSPFVVSASSSLGGTYEAYRSFDESTVGWWVSDGAQPLPQWIKVDLGGTYLVSGVSIMSRSGGDVVGSPKNFKIQVSPDDSVWYDVATFQGIVWDALQTRIFIFPETSGRYLRIYITELQSGTYASWNSTNIFGR